MEQRKKNEFIAKNMFWMATGLLTLFFVYVFCITFIEIPDKNQKYVDIILGFLSGTTVSTVIGYYFGTSSSNQQKDKNLEDMMDIHKGTIVKQGTEIIKDTMNDIKEDLKEGNLSNIKDNVVEAVDKVKDLFDPKDIPPPLDPDAT